MSKVCSNITVWTDIRLTILSFDESKPGFVVSDRGCCGTGNIEVTFLCNKLSPDTCTNVSEFVFWDSYHPSEKAYRTLLTPLINKYINRFFWSEQTSHRSDPIRLCASMEQQQFDSISSVSFTRTNLLLYESTRNMGSRDFMNKESSINNFSLFCNNLLFSSYFPCLYYDAAININNHGWKLLYRLLFGTLTW